MVVAGMIGAGANVGDAGLLGAGIVDGPGLTPAAVVPFLRSNSSKALCWSCKKVTLLRFLFHSKRNDTRKECDCNSFLISAPPLPACRRRSTFVSKWLGE